MGMSIDSPWCRGFAGEYSGTPPMDNGGHWRGRDASHGLPGGRFTSWSDASSDLGLFLSERCRSVEISRLCWGDRVVRAPILLVISPGDLRATKLTSDSRSR